MISQSTPALYTEYSQYFLKVKLLSCVRLCDPWTVAYHAPPSMGFSRLETWSGLPFPSPGDIPNPGSPALQTDAVPSEPPGTPKYFLIERNKERKDRRGKERKGRKKEKREEEGRGKNLETREKRKEKEEQMEGLIICRRLLSYSLALLVELKTMEKNSKIDKDQKRNV